MFIRRMWPSPSFMAGTGLPDPAKLRRDMERLFDVFLSETPARVSSGVFPLLNVTQDEQNFFVRAEVPGINPSDLGISVERNKLLVSGKREIPPESEKVSYHRRERTGGAFSRSLTLPVELDPDRVEAGYADGVLTIKLPKAEAAKARQIRVQVK